MQKRLFFCLAWSMVKLDTFEPYGQNTLLENYIAGIFDLTLSHLGVTLNFREKAQAKFLNIAYFIMKFCFSLSLYLP